MPKAPPKHPTTPTARSETAATPMAFVHAVLQAYGMYGQDPSPALQAAQIAPSMLRQSGACVTASQFEALCSVAMQQLDDEALGWYSRRLPWGSYGMLCRASLSSPDLGIALRRWCRHHGLLTDDVRFTVTVGGDTATLAVDEINPLRLAREFCLMTSLRYVHGFACWLIDSRLPLIEVALPFPRPAHGDVHALLFPGPVRFDADRASMRFESQYLSLPSRRDEQALRLMLKRALPLTVRQYRRDRMLARRVRDLLREHPGDQDRADELATRLHMSMRTLHRHLHEEGTSLQALKDQVRRELAIEQLCRSQRPIKQIAHASGFDSDKSFARAFKQWTGETPSAYRRKAMLGSR